MKTTLYQLKTGNNPLIGMSYLIQATEGSLIVIDGGMSIHESKDILALLQKLSPEKIPVVSAWFITHAHLDHTLACQRMAEQLSDQVKVEKMIYNFPTKEFNEAVQSQVNREIPAFEKALENFEGVEILTPVTGDRFVFGETVFDVLFTWEDLPPLGEGIRATMNDTSTVLRMSAHGQTVLFLGDAAEAADAVMMRRYGKELKSDICQIAHHGSKASTAEFYSYVDPQIVLWPCSEREFPCGIFMCEADRYLVRDAHVEEIIVAGYGTRRMELPLSPAVAPLVPPCPRDPKDDTPAFTVPFCDREPTLDDPLWSKEYPLEPKSPNYTPDIGGKVSYLYTKDALYFKVTFLKAQLPSNPLRHGTANSNNIHLYFSETPILDYKLLWPDVEGEGCYSNVKFFPEDKVFAEAMQNNTHPEFCDCQTRLMDGGYEMLCRVNWAKKHQSGDRISLSLEVTAVDRPDGPRTVTLYSTAYYEGYGLFVCPANMAIGVLE